VLLVINWILSGNKPHGVDVLQEKIIPMIKKESIEHPTLPPQTIKQIVKDHSG
jgi:hypothetical protein